MDWIISLLQGDLLFFSFIFMAKKLNKYIHNLSKPIAIIDKDGLTFNTFIDRKHQFVKPKIF